MEEPIPIGEVALNLTSKGFYTWKVRIPILRTDMAPDKIVNRLKKIDNKLKDQFPRYAGYNRVSYKSFKKSF